MTDAAPERPLRVLVIDDSAAQRRAITAILETTPGVTVCDRAADGEEGLRKALALRPDVITLDLEMPRLDGYAFLRLLMAQAPTPVIVLSSYGHPSDVFKALQLGAFDFVARPSGADARAVASVRSELVEKLRAVRFARRAPAQAGGLARTAVAGRGPAAAPTEASAGLAPPVRVVAVGASTGGPPAVQRLLERLAGAPVCVLVAQHMPPRFTRAFAARLDQALPLQVSEARSGEPLAPGRVYVAPGGEQLELEARQGQLVLAVQPAAPADRYAPSVDRLFASVARHLGPAARGVVLTGMGADGAEGARALRRAGAEVWAEDEASAAVSSMPEAAIRTGAVSRILPVDELGAALARALGAPRR